MWRMSVDEQRRAQQFLEQAIALDSEYAHAYALLGWTHVSLFNLDARAPISAYTDKALGCGARRPWRSIARNLGATWFSDLGHARRRRPEPRIGPICRRSIELNPNFTLGHAGLGYAWRAAANRKVDCSALEQAQRLSPRDPFLAIYAPTVPLHGDVRAGPTRRRLRSAVQPLRCIPITQGPGD